MRDYHTMELAEYHERTKHSPRSVMGGPGLDWSNRPRLFKRYLGLPRFPLPLDLSLVTAPALDAICSGNTGGAVTVETLAGVLHLTGGITKWLRVALPGAERHPFRAAACTGALYHIEIYVVCADIPGVEAGVYQAAMDDLALAQLRKGDHRRVLAEATGGHPRVAEAPATLVFTTTYWRNAWKYRDRMYRHAYWDSGTMAANLLAAANALGLEPEIVLGFADGTVNDLLGLDETREVALYVVPLGREGPAPPPVPPIDRLRLPYEPYSRHETDYPLVREAHAASSFATGEEAATWRSVGDLTDGRASLSLPPSPPLPEVVRRRGSPRMFSHAPISAEDLASVLAAASAPIPWDAPVGSLTTLSVIAHAVTGLEPGVYSDQLVPVRLGSFRQEAGHLALGQALAADAAANVYALADLSAVLRRLGGRGYRAAQLEGGVRGGRMYLAACARGFGATGLTFFDDMVSAFLGEPEKAVMFLTALGHRA